MLKPLDITQTTFEAPINTATVVYEAVFEAVYQAVNEAVPDAVYEADASHFHELSQKIN
jgi:L-aminopeptidase/D-esterase-like protein